MAYLVGLWIVVAAASQLFNATAYAHAAALDSRETDRSLQPAEEAWVEFDLPPDFWEERDGSYVVTGFRLGYFRTNGNDPLLTSDFRRGAVEVDRESGRLPLDVEWLARSRQRVVVRLKTLTADGESDWSEPSESISISMALDWIGSSASKTDR